MFLISTRQILTLNLTIILTKAMNKRVNKIEKCLHLTLKPSKILKKEYKRNYQEKEKMI